ncbi:hypothetical protein EDB86DRAFT_2829232 [Lactarius hatsudake]|nr:hypothetical protein EDB86DRAFT_2829232 [Lactarius hatsudake]
MPEHVCTCKSCSRYNVKDPVTGFTVPGHIVGKKEFLSHRRLETIKQWLGDTTDDDCTSSHRDPRSNNRTTPNMSEQPEQEPEKPRHLRIPTQRLQDRAVKQELQDLLDAMRSELCRRRMDFLSFPTRGLVFASLPDLNTSRSTARLEATGENLNLSPDALINKKLIEYEGWLQHSLSSCTQPFAIHSAKYLPQDCLVDEITQAIQEVQATKVEEWTCQIAALKAQAPLPPTVVKRKCVIVEGGLAILHLVLNISIGHSGFVSLLFWTILDLCLSQISQRSVEVHAIVSSIPLEVQTILGILNLRTHTLPFICCPGCYKLYPDSSECPDLCTHRPAPDSEMCKAPLYSKRKNRGKAK